MSRRSITADATLGAWFRAAALAGLAAFGAAACARIPEPARSQTPRLGIRPGQGRRRRLEHALGDGRRDPGMLARGRPRRRNWRPFWQGTAIGVAGATLAFPRTAGRIVRLHVLEAEGAPTIWDFELYGTAPAPGR